MVYDIGLGDNIFVDDIYDAAMQEIDILFNTDNTELIGYPNYGMEFSGFLHELTPNENSLKNYINDQINENTMYLSNLNYSIDVKYITDNYEDPYYSVIISIYSGNTNNIKKTKIVTIK